MGRSDDEEAAVTFRRGSKYRNSAKTLLPYRRPKTTGHPADNAGCFSTIFFSWITRLVWKLYRSPVTVEDLWKTPQDDRAIPNAQRFERLWNAEVNTKKEKASMRRVIFRFLRTRIIVSVMAIIVFVSCQFASNGIIIRQILLYVEDSEHILETGILLVLIMLLSELTRAMMFSMAFALNLRSGIRLRAAVTTFVFQKMMRVPPTEKSSIGEIVNMCSSDGDRLFEATYLSHLMFTSPIMFTATATYLCILLGPVALVGCGLFVVVMMIQLVMLSYLNKVRQNAVAFTDKRVKAINEVLSFIKLIKMYGWEKSFLEAIRKIRHNEKVLLSRALFFQSFNMSIAWLAPYLATILVILCAIILGDNITTPEAFTCFTLLNAMSFSLKAIPFALKQFAEAGVAADRLHSILNRKEYIPYLKSKVTYAENAIEFSKATLSWATDEGQDQDGSADNRNDRSENVDLAEENEMLPDNTSKINDNKPCINQVNLEIEKGMLVGICGEVGSGKSSLISAILGHLELQDGSVVVDGTTAYCAQQAWIMNATIRDNITFGLPYVKKKYDRIVEACCLLPDFEILQSGDLTEVGERGVNMSGGQKQRINIARAIYMDKDIYLLDDPLSAVDAHVGKAMFENAILKLLRKVGKTVVFVTHRLEYLPHCDQVVLLQNGKIREIGTHDDLLDNGDDYYQLFKMWSNEKQTEDKSQISSNSPKKNDGDIEISATRSDADKRQRGRLMTVEEKARGAISSSTYVKYIKAAGGWLTAGSCILIFLIYVCCLQFNSFWLSYWLKQGSGVVANSTFDISTLGTPATQPTITDVMTLNATVFWDSSLNSTVTINTDVANLTKVTLANTAVGINSSTILENFQLNPTTSRPTVNGDITLSKNSSETHLPTVIDSGRIIDNPHLYSYLKVFVYSIAATIVAMTVKSLVYSTITLNAAHNLHNNLLDIVLHGTMEFFDTTPTGRILNRFQKDQDMLDSVIPLLVDFVLTFGLIILSCLAFIAFVFPYFLLSLIVIVPIFLLALFMFKGAVTEMRRLDNITRSPWLSHITTTLAGIHTILAYQRVAEFTARFRELLNQNTVPYFLYASINRWLVLRLDFVSMSIAMVCIILAVFTVGILPPSYAALAVSSALMLSVLFQFTVRTTVETEANMVCAERVVHYINTIPQEPRTGTKNDLDPKWPQFGSIQFKNVCMRYRDGLPLVLNEISFNIDTRDKIGVVGRTGSGKSSLGVALFRLVELVGGEIHIDGVNIAELSLHQLRSKVAIIPQEPVLFSGTIKYNVDPFNQYNEDDIWLALERTHMLEAISDLPQKLEAPVSENGSNFSVGERQLLCLTRALLRKNKILFLDEATASIDARTDKLVQETINLYFNDCTLITIAHRLRTVLNCDKIMVLDNGSVVEFDTPSNLSSNPNSLFSQLLKSTEV